MIKADIIEFIFNIGKKVLDSAITNAITDDIIQKYPDYKHKESNCDEEKGAFYYKIELK